MVKIDRHQWRVHLLGRRVHHGLAGLFLIGFGVVLCIHDRHDAPWLP